MFEGCLRDVVGGVWRRDGRVICMMGLRCMYSVVCDVRGSILV
jgi:hypothetical protein